MNDQRVLFQQSHLRNFIPKSGNEDEPGACGRGLFLFTAMVVGNARDGVNFDFDAAPERGLNGGARRAHAGEMIAVGAREGIEIVDVGDVAGAFHNVVEGAAGGGEYLPDIFESGARFFFDGAAFDFHCR